MLTRERSKSKQRELHVARYCCGMGGDILACSRSCVCKRNAMGGKEREKKR